MLFGSFKDKLAQVDAGNKPMITGRMSRASYAIGDMQYAVCSTIHHFGPIYNFRFSLYI